jgi:hypothetical protein
LGGSARIIAEQGGPDVFPFINAWTLVDEGLLVMANEGALRSLLGNQFCQMTEALEICCHDQEDDRDS